MKKETKKNKRNLNQKGITLIALVITIIVLLILAGVAIAMLTGDNGILKQAVNAKEETEVAQEKEAIILLSLSEKENKLGIPLVDRSLENGENWDIIYVTENNKTYGTNWNYIPEGTNVPEYGKAKHNWVVNYETGEIINLGESTSYQELNVGSSVAVRDNLALNIDASNLSNDNWGENIIKHGNVNYDSTSNAISFNQQGEKKGDYLELTKPGDFSKGFTFEIYMNLDETAYLNENSYGAAMGYFCKIEDLHKTDPAKSMRFLYTKDTSGICKFGQPASFVGIGDKLKTEQGGGVLLVNGLCYNTNEDVYITFVYEVNNEEGQNDKISYYINGNLYGWTYYGHETYQNGCNIWNKDNYSFFIGVCPWYEINNLYYLRGKVYTTRLYTSPLSENQVKENYDKTIDYRNYIKD